MTEEINSELQSFMKELLEGAQRRNQSYSLRAFASDAGLSVSFASEVLSGRKTLSAKKASMMADKLRLSTLQRIRLIKIVGKGESRRDQAELDSLDRQTNFERFDERKFQILDKWYYLAILEHLTQEAARTSPEDIARHFQLTPVEVTQALADLEAQGFISCEHDGIRVIRSNNTTPDEIPNRTIRAFHQQMLSLAQSKLDQVPSKERANHSLFFSAPRSKLPEIKAELLNFISDLCEKHSDRQNADTVFAFTAQIFPLDTLDQ